MTGKIGTGPSARSDFVSGTVNASEPSPMAISGLPAEDEAPDFLKARNLVVRCRYEVERILAKASKGNATGYVDSLKAVEAQLRQAEDALGKAEDQEKHRFLADAIDRIKGIQEQDRQNCRDSIRRAKDAIAVMRKKGEDESKASHLLLDAIHKSFMQDYNGAALIADKIPKGAV